MQESVNEIEVLANNARIPYKIASSFSSLAAEQQKIGYVYVNA